MAGNVSGAREVVQRHQFADYLNIGTFEKPNWVLMGVGFTTLDETFGAESEWIGKTICVDTEAPGCQF